MCDIYNKLAVQRNRFSMKSIQPVALTNHEFNRLVPASDAIKVGCSDYSLIAFSISQSV